MENLKQELRERVLQSFDYSEEITKEALYDRIDRVILSAAKERFLTLEKKEWLRREIYSSIRGLDILEELLAREDVTEIMVNGPEKIFYERNGKVFAWQRRMESPEKLWNLVQQMAAGANRTVNEASPIVDSRLSDGSRVNIVLPPVALNGPIVTIRKFGKQPLTMQRLLEKNAISEPAAQLLKRLVRARYNLFICGGTGSGKTTFLNALTEFIPEDERVVTIEDAAELQIRGIDNLVRLEARRPTSEECAEISIRDLIRTALRMRPDRIVVGEVRGSEAIDMLSAMNTGHDGSLSTGHGNSPADMLDRLETMVLLGTEIPLAAVRKQIASALDLLIHLGRLRDGSRRVLEIDEVSGCKDGEIVLNPLYVFREQEMPPGGEGAKERAAREGVAGRLLWTGNRLRHTGKLAFAGIAEPEDWGERADGEA